MPEYSNFLAYQHNDHHNEVEEYPCVLWYAQTQTHHCMSMWWYIYCYIHGTNVCRRLYCKHVQPFTQTINSNAATAQRKKSILIIKMIIILWNQAYQIQSSIVITRSNIVRYCINNYGNWSKISDARSTKHTPYLALMRELWGVFREYLWENWSRYNDTALYVCIWSFSQRSSLKQFIH